MSELKPASMFRVVRWRDAALLIGALVLVAVATLSLQQVPDVSPTTVALALLLIVLGTATIGRLRIAIIVAVAGMLVFNFFFLPPVRTFTIADPENWIALFAFLVVAVIASNLSASAQTRSCRQIRSAARRRTARSMRRMLRPRARCLVRATGTARHDLTAGWSRRSRRRPPR